MAEPKQKSLELPKFLTRHVPVWQTPTWMETERWRRVVENQPVAMVCEEAIISDLQDTSWEIRSKEPTDEDKLADDIEHYTTVLEAEMPNAVTGFDAVVIGMAVQDMLRIPIGGNLEIVRYPANSSPLSGEHPKGHVYKLVYIDGGSLVPTFDPEYPIMQKIPQDVTNNVYFRRNEILRFIQKPRAEMLRWGYQMAPPEKIYLAIVSLYRGDSYYANLLLDTPEAGLLDLLDMSRESAEMWLESFRELMTGIDPMKIPVLYEHEKPAQYINFGRPPTEMMFDTITLKYSQLTHAGYGLTVTDTGLGDPQKTLAGSIRDERRSRRSGYGRARETVKTAINLELLPPYLEFIWLENDPETLIQRGRAFLTYSQGLKAAKEAGFLSAKEGQAELINAGLITVEVEEPEEQEAPPPMLPAPNGTQAQQQQEEMDRKPPGEGGRGDVTGQATQKADLGPPTISAVSPDSSHYDQLAMIFKEAFAGVHNRMETPRLMKLIKAATRSMFPDVTQAFMSLADTEVPWWRWERTKFWFAEKSEFDELPDVVKAREELLAELDKLLDKESWWKIDQATITQILLILKLAFQEGATRAAQLVQEFLYTEGLRDTPAIIGLSFDLKNARTLAQLESKAALLVTRVNDGTRYYLKRIIMSGVDEGLASPSIAQMIRDGADVEAILKEAGYTSQVIDTVRSEVGAMSENRTNSIVNTEINRAESEGRLEQWREMGLTRKRWRHTGADDMCPICRANQELGFVEMDYVFDDVFNGTLTPPAHPQVCHCHIAFDEDELMGKADTLKIWDGS